MSYNQPPPAYPVQQQQQQGTTIIMTGQPAPVGLIQHFTETPCRITCPSCRADIVTSIHYETGSFAWIVCICTAFLGCWFGCCLIPFCVDGCKDVIHSCPNCRQTVGRFDRG